jgi:hypothetical protein
MNHYSLPHGFSAILYCALPLLMLPVAETHAGGAVAVADEAHLRAALAGGGTVTFAVDGTIALSGPLLVTNDTLIDATGHSIVIDGASAVRLFQVDTNVELHLKELTLANGRIVGANGGPGVSGQDAYGAGILNLGGTVTLEGCRLSGHQVQGGDGGTGSNPGSVDGGAGSGAAVCSLGGTLNLTNCTLAAGICRGGVSASSYPYPGLGTSGAALGAGIYAKAAIVYLDHVTLVNNQAFGGTPFVNLGTAAGAGGMSAGGAIYATNANLFVTSSSFVSNSVTGGTLAASGAVGGGSGSGFGLGGSLFVSAGCSGRIALSSFTACAAVGGGGYRYQPAGQGQGGALFNAGDLALSDCSFTQNQSVGGNLSLSPGNGQGGAVYSGGDVAISGCIFTDNFAMGGSGGRETSFGVSGGAGEGGALWCAGSIRSTNSTFFNNQVSGGSGGGALMGPSGPGTGGGVLAGGGTAILVNLTIAGNSAVGGPPPAYPIGPAQGGGLAVTNTAATVHNSIIANSTSGGDVWGTLIDGGHNICSDATANLSAPGSLNNTDPKLGPLGNCGGPTQTMPLLVGSPAINGGDTTGCPLTDQRGHSRPFGNACDIGAYESSPPFFLGGRVSGYTFTDPVTVGVGSSASVTTNGGNYLLSDVPAGPINVTPMAEGYLFDPPTRSLSLGWDRWDVDFTAYRWDSVSVEAGSVASLHLTYASRAGGTHWLLLSTDLVTWTPIYTNVTSPSNLFHFTDTGVTTQWPRFYRVYNP